MGILDELLARQTPPPGMLGRDPLGAVTANQNMLAQALKARQTTPRNALTGQGLLDTAAMGLSPVPVIGDALGLAADASRFYNEPESRTPLNFGLAALGLIPFVPPLVSAGLGKFAQSQGKQLANLPAGPGRNEAGAIVYHGSPHKFDRFDSSKIGTGEGAQAYGHGLYFAENPAVASGYKKSTSYQDQVRQFRSELPDDSDFSELLGMANSGALSPQSARLVKALHADDWLGFDYPAQAITAAFKNGSNFDMSPELKSAISNYGNIYKVDLPDEAIAKMLDYDAPLSKQPESVKKYLIDSGMARDVNKINTPLGEWLKTSGGISSDVSKEFASAGIPGIRYLDGGSRSAGSGTSNFVVFPGNEGLLKILESQ